MKGAQPGKCETVVIYIGTVKIIFIEEQERGEEEKKINEFKTKGRKGGRRSGKNDIKRYLHLLYI